MILLESSRTGCGEESKLRLYQLEHLQWTHLRGAVEGVGVEDRLDHDQRLSHVFPVQLVPVVGALVRTVVEDLKELRPAEMKHELRKKTE